MFFMKSVKVNSNDAGQRLDKFLLKHFESLPKSMMFKQIRKKTANAVLPSRL